MEMIVCCKQVADPEMPPASFKIDENGKKAVIALGVSQVISSFDEQAVEAALRIKDKMGGKITILSLGNNLLREVIKKPLSMGADELILLEDEAFVGGDSWSTALALAAAIKKIGKYDIIFCGRQAVDWDSGQVGLGISELLSIPCVTIAKSVEIIDNKAKVERVVASGCEVVETVLPALITFSNEFGSARYPNIKGIMLAKRKEPIIWRPADLGLSPEQIGAKGKRSQLIKIFQPQKEKKCLMLNGSPAEAGSKLALKIKEVC